MIEAEDCGPKNCTCDKSATKAQYHDHSCAVWLEAELADCKKVTEHKTTQLVQCMDRLARARKTLGKALSQLEVEE